MLDPDPGHAAMARALDGAGDVLTAMKAQIPLLRRMANVLITALRGGRKIMTCGNGGSAAEALHLAEELVGRFQAPRRALAGLCLCADATALTCIANDWEYAEVFARQIEAHGQAGDVLVVLSTSGRSASVVRALERGRSIGLVTVGLLGPSGSPAQANCDLCLTLEGHAAARVQEAHLLAIHLFLEQIDAAFAGLPPSGA